MNISDDRSQIKPCTGTSLHHQPTRRGMRKSIRTVNENFTQHHLSWNMLPILLNNKHPWYSQVENDHQPSVRAGLHTQTHACRAQGDSITSFLLEGPHKQSVDFREECWSLSSGWRDEGWRGDVRGVMEDRRLLIQTGRCEESKICQSPQSVCEKTQWSKGKVRGVAYVWGIVR